MQCPFNGKAFGVHKRPINTGRLFLIIESVTNKPFFSMRRGLLMNRKGLLIGVLAAGCYIATSMVMPSIGNAQADARVSNSMASLTAMSAKLGAPKLEGKEAVGGTDAPGLYFGST